MLTIVPLAEQSTGPIRVCATAAGMSTTVGARAASTRRAGGDPLACHGVRGSTRSADGAPAAALSPGFAGIGTRPASRRSSRSAAPPSPIPFWTTSRVAFDGGTAARRSGAELHCGARRRLSARLPGPAGLLTTARSRPRRHRLRAVAASIKAAAHVRRIDAPIFAKSLNSGPKGLCRTATIVVR
jgi:hypothetical protein